MKSFFEKLTKGDDSDDELFEKNDSTLLSDGFENEDLMENEWLDEEEQSLEMEIDLYQDQDNLYITAFVPGLPASSLNVDISRDVVSIRCTRERESQIEDENYFQQELVWGTFARKINLPREIDIEGAEAKAKDGMLTLTLPKIDKDRTNTIKVRNG